MLPQRRALRGQLDVDAVEAFYQSEDYAPLKAFRHTFATAHALVIEGL
ncbi:DUF1330 domain-containing protein [Nonomuraea roseoviolacea]